MYKKLHNLRKRPFTLLEVMICFLLLVIALVPLLAPYPLLFQQEKQNVAEIEMDREAAVFFVALLARLYKKELDPTKINAGSEETITHSLKLPYTAKYVFRGGFEVSIVFTPKSDNKPILAFDYVMPKVP